MKRINLFVALVVVMSMVLPPVHRRSNPRSNCCNSAG